MYAANRPEIDIERCGHLKQYHRDGTYTSTYIKCT